MPTLLAQDHIKQAGVRLHFYYYYFLFLFVFPILSSSFHIWESGSFFLRHPLRAIYFPIFSTRSLLWVLQSVTGNRREGDYWFQPCNATSPSSHKSAGLQEAVRWASSDFYTWFTVKSAQGLLGCLFSQKAEPAETVLLCRGEGFTHLEVTGDAGIEHYNVQYLFLIQLGGTKLCTCFCTCPEMLGEDL